MTNRFEKYVIYKIDDKAVCTNINTENEKLSDESFCLFKDLFDTHYGSINEDGNLISIHTGGWSENEYLVSEFKETWWWFKYHKITAKGGHFYFNKNSFHGEKKWKITAVKN